MFGYKTTQEFYLEALTHTSFTWAQLLTHFALLANLRVPLVSSMCICRLNGNLFRICNNKENNSIQEGQHSKYVTITNIYTNLFRCSSADDRRFCIASKCRLENTSQFTITIGNVPSASKEFSTKFHIVIDLAKFHMIITFCPQCKGNIINPFLA